MAKEMSPNNWEKTVLFNDCTSYLNMKVETIHLQEHYVIKQHHERGAWKQFLNPVHNVLAIKEATDKLDIKIKNFYS